MDRGRALLVHHVNLLKPWREVVPVALQTVISEKEELGPEVNPKQGSIHRGPLWSPSLSVPNHGCC